MEASKLEKLKEIKKRSIIACIVSTIVIMWLSPSGSLNPLSIKFYISIFVGIFNFLLIYKGLKILVTKYQK